MEITIWRIDSISVVQLAHFSLLTLARLCTTLRVISDLPRDQNNEKYIDLFSKRQGCSPPKMSESIESPQSLAATTQYIAAAENLRAAIPTAAIPLDGGDCHAYGAQLRGKTVVVTGAGSGFGRAFSIAAAKFG